MSDSNEPCGVCRWEFADGEWYVIDDLCEKDCVCARHPATNAPYRKGDKVADRVFREGLKQIFQSKTDVIPKNLFVANGTVYVMDCV
jgi:hypothetical protein